MHIQHLRLSEPSDHATRIRFQKSACSSHCDYAASCFEGSPQKRTAAEPHALPASQQERNECFSVRRILLLELLLVPTMVSNRSRSNIAEREHSKRQGREGVGSHSKAYPLQRLSSKVCAAHKLEESPIWYLVACLPWLAQVTQNAVRVVVCSPSYEEERHPYPEMRLGNAQIYQWRYIITTQGGQVTSLEIAIPRTKNEGAQHNAEWHRFASTHSHREDERAIDVMEDEESQQYFI